MGHTKAYSIHGLKQSSRNELSAGKTCIIDIRAHFYITSKTVIAEDTTLWDWFKFWKLADVCIPIASLGTRQLWQGLSVLLPCFKGSNFFLSGILTVYEPWIKRSQIQLPFASRSWTPLNAYSESYFKENAIFSCRAVRSSSLGHFASCLLSTEARSETFTEI